MNIVQNVTTQTKPTQAISVFENDFVFGNIVSPNMLIAQFNDGQWENAKIEPYSPLSLDPSTSALHYGQSVFEGMKAFRMQDDRISIFRTDKHFERFNRSLLRMHMPQVPEDLFVKGVEMLVSLDRDWVPHNEGSALYIRPFMFASDTRFGVRPSSAYTFVIFTGPVPAYFTNPLKVKIEKKFSRATIGGTGSAKCAGNYAGSFYPTSLAQEKGYDQVIWTDSWLHEFIEESGMMNIFLVIKNVLVTPALTNSILDGVTRDSFIALAMHLGIPCEERPVSIREITRALDEGTLTEMFGTGTAAVTAPVSHIGIDNDRYLLPGNPAGNPVMSALKQKLGDIRLGKEKDIFGWNSIL